MYYMLLNDILAKEGLFSGYSFREKIESNPLGSTGILQMKDVTDDYLYFDHTNMDKVSAFSFKEKFYLKQGDVLFVSKGVNNYAFAIEKLDFPVVPSATFFVIRVNENKIDAAYLAWYMNQTAAQNYFSEKKAGTYVPNLKKQDILDLPLKIPPLKIQVAIAQTARLLQQELLLLDKIRKNRKELIQNQLLNVLNND